MKFNWMVATGLAVAAAASAAAVYYGFFDEAAADAASEAPVEPAPQPEAQTGA